MSNCTHKTLRTYVEVRQDGPGKFTVGITIRCGDCASVVGFDRGIAEGEGGARGVHQDGGDASGSNSAP